MQSQETALLLRIFIGENDRFAHHPLYEAIVAKRGSKDLPERLFFAGPWGLAIPAALHTANILRLSEDLPVVVEIVDSEENIAAFLPLLDQHDVRAGSSLSKRFGSCATAPTKNEIASPAS